MFLNHDGKLKTLDRKLKRLNKAIMAEQEELATTLAAASVATREEVRQAVHRIRELREAVDGD
jgi:hypothetical protein